VAGRENATVTLSQIAELTGYGPSAVSNWRKRHEDFPRPVETAAGGRDLFPLPEVERWLRQHNRFKPDRRNELLMFEAANLLRASTTTDEGMHALAAAIALSDALDLVGVGSTPNVAARIALVEQREPRLQDVFAALQQLDPLTADQIAAIADSIEPTRRADVFEWVLARRTRFVETRTSDELTSLLVALAGAPRSLLDSTAGEGGVLATAAELTHRQTRLYGQEINAGAWRIAMQRFLLRKLDVEMEPGDSLLDDRFPDLHVDAVICDPPYAMRNPLSAQDGRQPHWASFGASRARTADFVWLEHAIEHLSENGHAYVVLPAGTLFRRGRERELRAELVRRGAVEAIVALPPGSAQHTAIALSLWIVQRPGMNPERPVLLVDASGAEPARRRRLDRELTERVVDVVSFWRQQSEVDERHRQIAVSVPILELLGSDADLVPARWLKPTETNAEERAQEASASIERFVAARNALLQGAPDLPQLDLGRSVEWVAVRDLVEGGVADVIRGTRVRPEDCLDEGVRVLRTRDIRETIESDEPCHVIPEEMKPHPPITQPGDIVLSPASGTLRSLVDEEGGHALASPLQVLRFRHPWLDPHVAAAFLESPRNRRFAKGTTWGYARVDLRDLELPTLSPEEAQRLRATIDSLFAAASQAREVAETADALRQTILELVGTPEADLASPPTSNPRNHIAHP
jgi:hypothetical protein